MLNIESVAAALVHHDITVAKLAPAIGDVIEKTSDYYRVKPPDPSVLEVVVGIEQGKGIDAAPGFVRFFFSAEHPQRIESAVTGCTEWQLRPNNPGASPYLYRCRFSGSTKEVEVRYFATLTGEIAKHTSVVTELGLQRNEW